MTRRGCMTRAAREEFARFFRDARARSVRSMRAFAEAEIVVPDGPFEGRRFRAYRQPYAGLWFDAVDSGRWNRLVATGPTQSGKSLTCFVIPTLYHLFEMQETVICGLPQMEMARDKWFEDLLPAIEKSRYKDLLPRVGGGSKGGATTAIRFRHGVTLRFMSGGGDDKSRAAFTSRVLCVTETDGLDLADSTSREADKLKQLEGRTRAYGERKRIYLECTVSIKEGRTWQEYLAGTQSRIALLCPKCRAYVTPERELLIGWQDAQSEQEARERSMFFCPHDGCGEAWSEADRQQANRDGRLAHRGQTIDQAGAIAGDEPATSTLGFRWSAVNNLFTTAAEIGAGEWRAARAIDEENAEKEQRQFVWCLPHEPPAWENNPLDAALLLSRQHAEGRGLVPDEALWITVGCDVGKWLLHWVVMGWTRSGRGFLLDYGQIEVPTASLGEQAAILAALRQWRDLCEVGWPGSDGQHSGPDWAWVDSGYQTDAVYAFVRESKELGHDWILPIKGHGAGQEHAQWYNRPKTTGGVVKHVGEGFHIAWLKPAGVFLVEIDANAWKSSVHARLVCAVTAPGALTLFRDQPRVHNSIAKHLTAEKEIEEFVPGRGLLRRWETVRKANHYLDAAYIGTAAGNLCGASIVEPLREEKAAESPRGERADEGRTSMFTGGDERAFFVGDRGE